jgi:hypothetical protein
VGRAGPARRRAPGGHRQPPGDLKGRPPVPQRPAHPLKILVRGALARLRRP